MVFNQMRNVPYDENGIPHPEVVWLDHKTDQRLRDLEQQYGNIPYLPLAMPKILPEDMEHFVDYYYQTSADGVRQVTSFDEPWSKEEHPEGTASSWHRPLWKSLEIYKNPLADEWFGTNTIAARSVDGAKLFPKLYEQIFDCLPFKELFFIRFWSNQRYIGLHKDQDWTYNIPMSFRSFIYDENSKDTFFMSKERGPNEVKIYTPQPDDTNTFAFNNGGFWHGADFEDKRKILMVVSGIPDPIKLDKILSTSMSKYKYEKHTPWTSN